MNVTGSAHATVSTVLKTVCHKVNHVTRRKLRLVMMVRKASALAPRATITAVGIAKKTSKNSAGTTISHRVLLGYGEAIMKVAYLNTIVDHSSSQAVRFSAITSCSIVSARSGREMYRVNVSGTVALACTGNTNCVSGRSL